MYRKLNKKDYTVGQEVVLKLNGNASRGKKDNAYVTARVVKIGHKLLTVCKLNNSSYNSVEIKINMETGFEHTDYTPNYVLYDSVAHFEDYIEAEKLIKELRNMIGSYGTPYIPASKIKEAIEILKVEEDE